MKFFSTTLSGTLVLGVLAASALMMENVQAEPWKHIGGDLAYVGPKYNATFKAGDTIPFEYTFYTIKMVATTQPSNSTNTTAPTTPAPSTGTATLTSLAWVGATGNQTLQVSLDNDRTGGYSSPCLSTDLCTGTYRPRRINLVIPAETYPSNYTIVLGYTFSLAGNRTLYYKEPVVVVEAGTTAINTTSTAPVYPGAPSVQVTLPVYEPPKSEGGMNQASKMMTLGLTVVASAVLVLFA